jgi:hopanoid biosynthesis associated protein HpnK
MLRLIVNGDDFGLTEGMNQGILKSFNSGILTSTSIMAGGDGFDNAIKIARENPELDLGIHLTLVSEKPVLAGNEIPSLLKSDGKFYSNYKDFLFAYVSGKFTRKEIKKELSAQIQKVLNTGLKLTHMDSHQHIHCFPRILEVVCELSREFEIPFIRFPREKILVYMTKEFKQISRMVELFVINALCYTIRDRVPKTTNNFVGFFAGGRLNKQNLMKIIDHLPNEGTCELMCHPGIFNGSFNPYSFWNYSFEAEVEALTDQEIINMIEKKGIILSSFKDEYSKIKHVS